MFGDGSYLVTDEPTVAEPWYMDFNNVMSVIAIYALICGVVCATIAHRNGRSSMLGFISGIFMGQLGVATYMIMGEKEHISGKKH